MLGAVFGKYIIKRLGKDRCPVGTPWGRGLGHADVVAETRSDGGRESSPHLSEPTDQYGYDIVGTPRIGFP
jgi:hypothetical protein